MSRRTGRYRAIAARALCSAAVVLAACDRPAVPVPAKPVSSSAPVEELRERAEKGDEKAQFALGDPFAGQNMAKARARLAETEISQAQVRAAEIRKSIELAKTNPGRRGLRAEKKSADALWRTER